VADASFDRALSVQVLEYVSDPAAALAELHRALRPGGRLVVSDVDWSTVSWHSADPDRMRRVLAIWDGHLADPCLPRTLAARLRSVGFSDVRAEGHTFASAEFTPDNYGGGPSADPAVCRRPRRHHRGSGQPVGGRAARTRGTGRVLLRLHPILLHRHPDRLTAIGSAQGAARRDLLDSEFGSLEWGMPVRSIA
jgi:SAM-dependent methyltransferase